MKQLKVRVTQMGYINHGRVKPGAIITVPEKFFSRNWMELLEEIEESVEEDAPKVKPKAKPKASEKETSDEQTPI